MKTLIFTLIVVSTLFATEKPTEAPIKAFLNDTPIQSKVYNFEPQGDFYYGTMSLVKLTTIFEMLDSKIEYNKGLFTIQNSYYDTLTINVNDINDVKFRYVKDKKEVEISESRVRYLSKYHIMLIDGEYYIDIATVRHTIKGALKRTDSSITLFTSDFVRNDIPGTLRECYLALDTIMKPADINTIKNSTIPELGQYHMTLGRWIRNHWIYPTTDRVSKAFLENEIRHPDEISSFIIIGYHYYLNEQEKEFKELLLEK